MSRKINKKTQSKSLADILFPIEDKVPDDAEVLDIPPEKRRLHTESYDFSIATIHEYLKNETMFVPKFQREYVWNRSQASRLIESLVIQCPVPVIYLNQERNETLAVIDGNQRLTSIRLFLENELELHGLTTYPELNGSLFSDLDSRIKRHILNRTLRCIAILKETHPQIKMDVFQRLNTGAVQLNPQEIRHGVYHGDLIDLVDDLSQETIWKKISGYRNDNRMKGSELILRYLSLLYDLNSYRKPLKNFLDQFCEKHSKLDEETKLNWKARFLSTIELVHDVFGAQAFRTIEKSRNTPSKNINAALFDSVMVSFSSMNVDKKDVAALDKEKFMDDYFNLIDEQKFGASISVGTSSTSNVKYRISALKKLLQKHF